MRATEFEFRNRFWIIAAIFCVAFLCYEFDGMSFANAVVRCLATVLGWSSKAISVRWVLVVGAGLTTLAAWLRTWAASYIGSDVIHDAEFRSERLVADGPYRYVRNPLYLGLILLSVGIALNASRIGFVIIVVGVVVFILRLIAAEESVLATEQGEQFREYRRRVPGLWPSWYPRIRAAGRRPHYVQAVLGESICWIAALATTVLAISLEGSWAAMIAICGGAISFVTTVISRHLSLANGDAAPAVHKSNGNP